MKGQRSYRAHKNVSTVGHKADHYIPWLKKKNKRKTINCISWEENHNWAHRVGMEYIHENVKKLKKEISWTAVLHFMI